MPQVIEIDRETEAAARSFLDALYYSDFVSAIGYRAEGQIFKAVAVNWLAEGKSSLDARISKIIADAGNGLDIHQGYGRIFPETVLYQPEINLQ